MSDPKLLQIAGFVFIGEAEWRHTPVNVLLGFCLSVNSCLGLP